MVYFGGFVKGASKSKKPAHKVPSHRNVPRPMLMVSSPAPKPLHLLTPRELALYFKANAGHLVLIFERESKAHEHEPHPGAKEVNYYIVTQCTIGVLGNGEAYRGREGQTIPTSKYVSFKGVEVVTRHVGPYTLKYGFDRLGNRIHVGVKSEKMFEVVVGDDAVLRARLLVPTFQWNSALQMLGKRLPE